MRTRTTLAGIAATASLAAAAPARAADEVVATVAKPTSVSAARGHAVWSAWDPAVDGYRLMHYDRTGRILPVQMPPNRVPFDADVGKDPHGGTMAVFSRCDRSPTAGSRGTSVRWTTTRSRSTA
jgi:hypothetical protein